RKAGIRAELYLGSGKMGAQLKYADKRGAPCVVIQGDDEKARGEVQIKDLVEGAKAAAEIASHEEWRERRPEQCAAAGNRLLEAVRGVLHPDDVSWFRRLMRAAKRCWFAFAAAAKRCWVALAAAFAKLVRWLQSSAFTTGRRRG